MEGTHFGTIRNDDKTEYQLEKQVVGLIKKAPALVLATFSALDVDRIVTLYRATRRTGRVFVADVYTAYVLYLINSEIKTPSPTAENGIRVYFNKRFEHRRINKIGEIFEPDRIELEMVLSEPDKYVMVFRPSMVDLDFKGKLPKRCRCLYGYWRGHLDRPDWVKLQEQIADTGGDFRTTHVSGHVYLADLINFIDAVDARKVIPIHTFEPQAFCRHFNNVQQLDDDEVLELD